MRSICYARNAARRFPPSCTKWPTRMRRSYARIAGRAVTAILRRLLSLWPGRGPSEEFLRAWFDRLGRYPFPSSVDYGAVASWCHPVYCGSNTVKRQLVARLPFWRLGHQMVMGAHMSNDNIDLLCEDCGQTFSDFLHEMADQNAKVTTCPKCGKIHEFPSKAAKPGARSVKKIV